jgi:hypothetical protein
MISEMKEIILAGPPSIVDESVQTEERLNSPAYNYEYLKRWLSPDEVRKIRNGANPHGIKLSRQQTYLIMKGKSKNYPFRNYLVQVARQNEEISTKQ